MEVEQFKVLAELQKENEEIFEKLEDLYIGKRNDIMFVNKYIQPNIQTFSHLRVNHEVAMFIFCKKTFMKLIRLKDDMKSKKNIFNIKKGFDSYIQS